MLYIVLKPFEPVYTTRSGNLVPLTWKIEVIFHRNRGLAENGASAMKECSENPPTPSPSWKV